ncbi:trafficking protein Mon1-domain-containing protein [Ochromonadaceae sp. CCMP2298]|nr:trafficking protein Mon1-domain-containing protein [Ochromonadaceae sp. CCMP2298]|mmetsp:Transcript_12566/g.27906  ORF Transcript_12566/g.27906 Transcript_12566/m.27906 type:complete len:570 (-) Transcript_12566:435-2144(-)
MADAMGTSSPEGPRPGWELEPKHIFILSSSGKPIFSRYGDEQELVTTFGLLQAMISIVLDSGDSIKSMRAGERKVVFFIRQSMYFVAMSSMDEPEAVLVRQLQFLYHQILLVLTSKVHDVFLNNPSADIRQLLGPDTTRLLSAACAPALTPESVAFEAVPSVACPRALKEEILVSLRHSVLETKAALGILLHKDKLLCYSSNATTELNLSTPDVLLLTHFVANSKSLRSNDHNWVPICLPSFNPRGYLQAYVSNVLVESSVAGGGEAGVGAGDATELTLIFVAASADPDVFKELLRGKAFLAKVFLQPALSSRLLHALSSENCLAVDRFLSSAGCLHFMFKYRPLLQQISGGTGNSAGRSVGSGGAEGKPPLQLLPSQFVSSSMSFPLDEPYMYNSIWTEYQRLALRMRVGSSSVECTLFPPPPARHSSSKASSAGAGSIMSGGQNIAKDDVLQHFTMASAHNSSTATGSSLFRSGRGRKGEPTRAGVEQSNALCMHGDSTSVESRSAVSDDHAAQLLSSLPSSDHALSYVVLDNGIIVVSLATFDSELFVTFPGTVGQWNLWRIVCSI